MILSDTRILEEIEAGNIKIEPFRQGCLGSNSYDVHLGNTLGTYRTNNGFNLDAMEDNPLSLFTIPHYGYVLQPGELYLGVTEEYTESHCHVPFIEGKSSVGRLGINIHATAGKGDVGFCNYWTLEISVIKAVRVYAGMPIGQLIYFNVDGEVTTKYNQKKSAKYTERCDTPQRSMMFKNF